MRDQFPEYYRPTPAEFSNLWSNCVFSFDANVLLDVYRYSSDSRNDLLSLLRKLDDRIWISHQAGMEFHRNRLETISKAHEPASRIRERLESLSKEINDASRQHPYLSGAICKEFNKHLTEAVSTIDKAAKDHPDLLAEDTIGDELASMLEGRVGGPYPQENFETLCREIELRFADKIPPGYADAKDKDGIRKYGDALVWFQLMDFAKAKGKPIVFVTGDMKEDWWLRHKGRTMYPRPELRSEFRRSTGQDFYMYETAQFIEFAKRHLKFNVSNALLAEAKKMERVDRRTQTWEEVVAASRREYDRTRSAIIGEDWSRHEGVIDRYLLDLISLEERIRSDASRYSVVQAKLKPLLSRAVSGESMTETNRVELLRRMKEALELRADLEKNRDRILLRRNRLGLPTREDFLISTDPEFERLLAIVRQGIAEHGDSYPPREAPIDD